VCVQNQKSDPSDGVEEVQRELQEGIERARQLASDAHQFLNKRSPPHERRQ